MGRVPVVDWTKLTSLARGVDLLDELCSGAIAQTFVESGDPADDPVNMTFVEFAAQVRGRIAALTRIGVHEGDVVALMMPLSLYAYPTLVAVMARATAAPLNYFLEVDTLIRLIEASGARFLLTGRQFDDDPAAPEKIRRIREAIPDLVHIAIGEGPPLAAAIDLDALAARQSGVCWPVDLLDERPERVAALFHTGGTTGTPKLVPHTEGMYRAMLKSCGEAQGTVAGEAMLSALPLFHTSGALQAGLVPLLNGARIVIPSSRGFRDPNVVRNYWRFVERYAITVGAGVPTVLAALAASSRDGDVSSLRHILCGGAPLSTATIEALSALTGGVEVLEGWGMTETCGFSVLNPRGRTRVGSAGLPFPGVEAEIRQANKHGELVGACPTNTIGELVVRGDIVIKRYADDRPASFTGDGWLRTGDLARRDPDGFVWITGRAKDLIIRGGHNLDPALIEDPAYQHPCVQLAAAIGRPDKYAGELPILFVQLKAGATTDEAELGEFIRARIQERAATPKAIHIVQEIPLSGPGKISKLILRQEAIRAVFQAEIDSLPHGAPQGVKVAVAEDRQLGTMAVLSVAPPGTISEELRENVDAALRDYTIGYRWSRQPGENA